MAVGRAMLKLTSTFMIVLLSVGLTLGIVPVSEDKIKQHLRLYFKNIETATGVPETSVDSALKKFTDGSTMSKFPGVKLKQVAEVVISVQENNAIVGHQALCVMADQDYLESLYADGWHDHSFEETFKHYLKLSKAENSDKSVKTFCNFFAYLRCEPYHDPKTSITDHRCLCPRRMVWQGAKCVFRNGEKCDDLSGLNAEDKPFPVFDYKTEDFTRIIPSNCEGKSKCRHGESNTCELDEGFDYDASISDLSAFLRYHIQQDDGLVDDFSEGTLELEMLRHALKDITKHYRQPFRRALSLEMHMESHKLGYGADCNHAVESSFWELLDKYNKHQNPNSWNANGDDIGLDNVRMQFLKKVKTSGIKVCNPFIYLECQYDSKACECISSTVYDKDSGSTCVFKKNDLCNIDATKRFKLRRQVEPADSSSLIGISYYDYVTPECIWNAPICHKFFSSENFGEFCVESENEERFANEELQTKFEAQFSIEINGACKVEDQKKLLETVSTFHWDLTTSMEFAKQVMRNVIDLKQTFCRIRQHAICSEKGKCTCIKPTVPEGGTCAVPNQWKCNQAERSEFHQQLDQINLPLHYWKEMELLIKRNHLPCATNVDCFCLKHKYDNPREDCLQGICTCTDGKHGEQCEKHPIHHLAHLDYRILPYSMKNPEGFKILSDLHEPITKLDGKMTLEYDQSCDPNANKELESIFGFLAMVREECHCKLGAGNKFECRGCSSSSPEFQKPKFEEILKAAQSLASKTGAVFCNWNRALRCIDSKCGCAQDYFYEDNHCRVDLGGRCYQLKIDDDYTATCRSGLDCLKPVPSSSYDPESYKRKPRCEVNKSGCKDCKTPAEYVAHAKKNVLEKLKGKDKELRKRQVLEKNQPCSQENEKKYKTVMSKIEMAQKASSAAGTDLEKERQQVRLMEEVLASAEELLIRNFCKAGIPCSEKTSKCGDKLDMSETQKPSKTKSNSGSHNCTSIVLSLIFVGFSITFILFS